MSLHVSQGKQTLDDSKIVARRIYTLLLEVKRDIWNIFLDDEEVKKMRTRQKQRALSRVEHNCKQISDIIKVERSLHQFRNVVKDLVFFVLVSEWTNPENIHEPQTYHTKNILHSDQETPSEMQTISSFLQLLWMNSEALNRYLTRSFYKN